MNRQNSKRESQSGQKKGIDKVSMPCYNTLALKGCTEYRGVEQLEARRAHNPEVVGSSPASATRLSSHSGFAMTTFLFEAVISTRSMIPS